MTVSVHAIGNVSSEQIETALQGRDLPPCDILLTDDYLRPEIGAFNQAALASQRRWMLVKPVGIIPWIGPVFDPPRTACWECLAERLRQNREVEGFIARKSDLGEALAPSFASLPATEKIAIDFAITHLMNPERLTEKVATLDLSTLGLQIHHLRRRPQCHACGDPHASERAPIILRSVRIAHGHDGGHRSASPEETVKRLDTLVSPITGVVNFLQKSETLDGCAHVYGSGHNFARMNDEYYFLRASLRSQSAGKGSSETQAKASAIGEAVERFSGVFRGDEKYELARLSEMGDRAIHPDRLLLYSERQYAERDTKTQDVLGFNYIPFPFDDRERTHWTPAWSLTRQEWRYLPTAFCYYGYPQPDRAFCWADSNGCAAGNTLEEAILQGCLELIERDAVAIWWYNRLSCAAVDLGAMDDAFIDSLRDYYAANQRDLWVLDITSDCGVPTFAAVSPRLDGDTEDILLGFGCHGDARVAVLRAVTEMNQSLSIALQWQKPGVKLDDFDQDTLQWWQTATVQNQPYLQPRGTARKPRSLDWSDDLRDNVELCRSTLEAKGLEMIVLDQTRADVGLHVCKVVVPGLRHFWARFAPGRLYDVPVQLGRLAAPLREDQLNPVAMFL